MKLDKHELLIQKNKLLEELQSIETKLKECQEWQPKGGEWYISCSGQVFEGPSSDSARLNGFERSTKEHAERTSIEIRKFARLLALRDELCNNPVIDWEDSYSSKYYVYFDHEENKWDYSWSDTISTNIGVYFSNRDSAKNAVCMLNSGEVKL